MEEQELQNNAETTEKTAEININADENAAGTSNLNEPPDPGQPDPGCNRC